MGIIDKTNEGHFTYDSDGGALCWTNWHKGEPNDWGKGEDCTRSGHGHNDVNKWNDSPCEREKYSVVCEKSGIPTLILWALKLVRVYFHFYIIYELKNWKVHSINCLDNSVDSAMGSDYQG